MTADALAAQFIARVTSWTWAQETDAGPTGFVLLAHPTPDINSPHSAASIKEGMTRLADALCLASTTEKIRDIGPRVELADDRCALLRIAKNMPHVQLTVCPDWARRVSAEKLPIVVMISMLSIPEDTPFDQIDLTLRTSLFMRSTRMGETRLVTAGPRPPPTVDLAACQTAVSATTGATSDD